MTIAGVWDVTMRTPIGTLAAVYTFRTGPSGAIEGAAHSGAEQVPLTEIGIDGDRVTWKQSVTRPMRLHLVFEVTVAGGTLAGHSRAGRLPKTPVAGVRRAPSPAT